MGMICMCDFLGGFFNNELCILLLFIILFDMIVLSWRLSCENLNGIHSEINNSYLKTISN